MGINARTIAKTCLKLPSLSVGKTTQSIMNSKSIFLVSQMRHWMGRILLKEGGESGK